MGTANLQAAAAGPCEDGCQPAVGLDREGFARELGACAPSMRLIAAAIVGRSDAEDAVQQAAITAMDKLSQFTPGTSFPAWMAAIVRNTSLNMRRGEVRRTKRRLRLWRSGHTDSTGDPNAHRMQEHADTPSESQLEAALDVLPQDQRTCLLLKVVMEHPYSTIAEITGIPEATARSHVLRARQKMRKHLAPAEGSPSTHATKPKGDHG